MDLAPQIIAWFEEDLAAVVTDFSHDSGQSQYF